MGQMEKDREWGHFLSLVLRHQPSAAHIHLDAHGWADVQELLAGCGKAGKHISRDALERIVKENDKQRYSFNGDHTKIRANQGHSIPVDVQLQAAQPPARLYHGTAARFMQGIRAQGITRQGRQYVHLSDSRETALKVGSRHGIPVALPIDAAAMVRDGHTFYRSENGVWLCWEVPWAYVVQDGTDDPAQGR